MLEFLRRLLRPRPRPEEPPPRDVAALAMPLTAPAVHLVKASAPARSHLGGAPRLPAGTAWPTYGGNRLGFLGRLSLAELQQAQAMPWLPSSGALLFFYDLSTCTWGYDPKHRGSAVVLLVPDLDAPLEQPPAGLPAPSGEIRHHNVSCRAIRTFPSFLREEVRALGLTDAEDEIMTDLTEQVFGEAPVHQVGGFPWPIQDDGMEEQCQLVTHGIYCGDASGAADPRAAALRPGAAAWRLLLQLDTDDELRIMWGDLGRLYFWVREDAARAGDFSGAWLILQCH